MSRCKYTILVSLTLVMMLLSFPVESFAYSYYGEDSYYNNNSSYCDHDWETTYVRIATPAQEGLIEYRCSYCGLTEYEEYDWTYEALDIDSGLYKSYDVIWHSTVYPSSKAIKLKLKNAFKGSEIRVKIGKKTYTKKVGNKKKYTIKIKNPKLGNRVSIKVYYKGSAIGYSYWYDNDDGEYVYEEDEIVYYAKNIRKGMTKKQVKCTYYWGEPSDTASSSGGWSYWYYDDGSYIYFKGGRVYYWYDAAD